MMMIFCSLVKIITKHTQITHTNTKKNFFYLVKLSRLWLYIATHISTSQHQICHAYVSSYTHISNITFMTIHKYNLHKQTHTQRVVH